MSDEETRVSEETAAEEVVSADEKAAPEADENGGVVEAPKEEAEAEEASEGKRNRKSARERIAELTRLRRDAEERARKAEEALAKRPMPEDYDDHAAYEEARDDYLYNRRRAREERERAHTTAQTIEQETLSDFRSHEAAFKGEAPDYEEVAWRAPISDLVANVIAAMGEDGPRVLYSLGKDPALAKDLSSMPPHIAAVELGRLAGMAKPQRKLASKAPPPVAPVTGAGGPVNRDLGDMSPAEYRAFRASQKRK